jgi:AraC-like DNA-binding protein
MSPQGSDSGPLTRAVDMQAEREELPGQTYALGALRYPRPLSRDEAGQLLLDNLTAFQSSSSTEPGRRSLADHRRGPESGPLPAPPAEDRRAPGVTNPNAFEVGRAGLVVVLSSHAVKEACAERGWSLSELSRRAGISRPTLASALHGRPVRSRTAWKVARALEQGAPTQLARLLKVA